MNSLLTNFVYLSVASYANLSNIEKSDETGKFFNALNDAKI